MAAKRALSTLRAIPGLRSRDCYELGMQFRRWFDFFADDGVLDAGVDVCDLRSCVCAWVGLLLGDLSGDERIGVGGCERVADGFLWCRREFAEG